MKQKEVRVINGEIRAIPESRTIEGYAAIYNEETDLGLFREMIMPGAFDGADMADVRALFNHNPDNILARTASGTMRLQADGRGLKYTFEMPDTTMGNDLLTMIRRGDISQSSFAFTVAETDREDEKGKTPLRKITRFDTLYDVSPVTYPAYASTSVQARSLEQIAKEEHLEPEEISLPPADQAEQIQNELRQMDERVREAQFSLIQTSLHNDY